MRDITLEDTFYAQFTTRAFATGIPTTLAGTPVVVAYEDDSTTEITAGITLTVDHDSVTGKNLLTVVATAANGYENGKDYALVITTGTVDSISVVGEVVAEFSVGRSAAALDLANGTDGLGALKALIDTMDTVVDAIKAVTDLLPDAGALSTIGTDTARLTAVRAAVLTDWIDGGRLDLLLDAIPTTAMRGTDSAALASEVTTARMSELDDSAGKLVAVADLIKTAADAIKLETDKLTLGDAGAGVAGSILEEIETRPTTAMRGTDSAALASVATEARLAELDAANLPTDIAAIPTTAMRGTDNVVLAGPTKAEMDTAHALLATPAQVNTEVDNAFTTQMADSVPVDGSLATREQALYMVLQFLTDFGIAGTTLTVRKVDGSTALMTFTLDDDTAPTDITRTS